MKILFKTIQRPKNQLRSDEQADYQSDLLFHGLRSLYGADCVDVPKKDYMYKSYALEDSLKLWGKGFTYSRTLDDIDVDRNVSPNEVNLVVFSVHHSVQFDFDYQVSEFLKLGVSPDRVAVVDGHDWQHYNEKLLYLAPNFFKREVADSHPDKIKSVWFAIPKEKVVSNVPNKLRDFARIYPGSNEPHWPKNSRASHTFVTEADYYREYQESRFAFTCKKGGWDCMRHLEIIGNGCIPIFTDVEMCPNRTCKNFNKAHLSLIKELPGLNLAFKGVSRIPKTKCYYGYDALFGEETWTGDNNKWQNNINILFDELRLFGTTEYLAQHVIRNCTNAKN